jgi:hypothetical protein
MLHGITILAAAAIAQGHAEPPLAVYKAHTDAIPREVWQTIAKVDLSRPGLVAAPGVSDFSAEATAKVLRAYSLSVSRIVEASREPSFGVDVTRPVLFDVDAPADFLRASASRRARMFLQIDAGRAWHEGDLDGAAFRLAAVVRISAQAAKGPNVIDALSGSIEDLLMLIDNYLATGCVTPKGKQALCSALEKLDPDDPWGMSKVWFAEAARARQWASEVLLAPDGPKKWNNLIQEEGRDIDEWRERQREVTREIGADEAKEVLKALRGTAIKYKGYSSASLSREEIESKLAASKRLAEELHRNWFNSAATVQAITKAADEDKSQIIRLTLVNAFPMPPLSVRAKVKLRETLDKLNAP